MTTVHVDTHGNRYVGIVQEDVAYLDIPEATRLLGVRYPQYTRRLLLAGRLDIPHPAVSVPVAGFSKWYISVESVQHYLQNRGSYGRGGTRRYILHAERRDEPSIRRALDDLGVKYTLEFAYKSKGAK